MYIERESERERERERESSPAFCVPYLPVDIHFIWQMAFDFDIFRVFFRSYGAEEEEEAI